MGTRFSLTFWATVAVAGLWCGAPAAGAASIGRVGAGPGHGRAGAASRPGVVMGSLGRVGAGRGFRGGVVSRGGFGGFRGGFQGGFHGRFDGRFDRFHSGFHRFHRNGHGFGGFPFGLSYSYLPYSYFPYSYGYDGLGYYPGYLDGFNGYRSPYEYSGYGSGSSVQDLAALYALALTQRPYERDAGRPYAREEREGRNSYTTPDERPEREAPRGGERYYLEPAREERAAPSRNPVNDAKERLRVEEADRGVYLVRWTGPISELKSFEIQAADPKGEELQAKTVQTPPFRTLLRVPAGAASVIVTLSYRDGSTLSLKLPVEEFRALAERAND